jgi:hypothetical protein
MIAGRCWPGELPLLQQADWGSLWLPVLRPVEGANAFRLAGMLQYLRIGDSANVGREHAGITGSACF